MTEPTLNPSAPPDVPAHFDPPEAAPGGLVTEGRTSSLPAWRPWLTGRQQWAELIASPHTAGEWAVIGEAIRIADAYARAHTDSGEPVARGDKYWCQFLFDELETAAATAGPDQVPGAAGQLVHCVADPGLIRVWLTAPAAYSGETVATVADALDLPTWGHATDAAAHRAVELLLRAAQDAGVFGVDGHRAECHRIVDSNGIDVGHLLVARPPIGAGVAAIATKNLVPSNAASPIDAAVHVITAAAAHLDAILIERDYADALRGLRPQIAAATPDRAATAGLLPQADVDIPYRTGPGGRAFPALDQIDPSVCASDPPPPPPTELAADHRR